MKSSCKIIFKVCLITYLLCLTPFFSSLPDFLGLDESFMTSNVYTHDFNEKGVSIKEQLNLMKVNEAIKMSSQDVSPIKISSGTYVDNSKGTTSDGSNGVVPDVNATGKKVYIYNTHQQEGYDGGKTVVDAGIELANQLQEAGIQVVYESNDFPAYLKSLGLDYNSSYKASSFYLNEALVNYGGFDLIIDFHRDAVPRESSYVKIGDLNYARMMFVIGGLSHNVETITNTSSQITGLVNEQLAGVIKEPFTREAYYNQDVSDKMVLVEVGSDNNPYEEVSNSTKLLGKAVIQYLTR